MCHKAKVFGFLIMTGFDVGMKVIGLRGDELAVVYGKQTFVEEVATATRDILSATRSGAMEHWCILYQKPVQTPANGNIADNLGVTKWMVMAFWMNDLGDSAPAMRDSLKTTKGMDMALKYFSMRLAKYRKLLSVNFGMISSLVRSR